MSHPEIVLQSMVDIRTVVLKPHLDQGDVQLIGEKIKRSLFSKRFGFKLKVEDVRFLSCETYFEPYLIIGGKYILDYCKKHVFKVNVHEKTTKVLVGGQEFESEQIDPDIKSRAIRVKGEEYAHHEKQTYFILDRMKREIEPEKLPISPFRIQREGFSPNSNFKSMQISDEMQIEFLKARIARRPVGVGEIIREVFEITERTIIYYPMYELTFENAKDKKDATITINGITGETILNGNKQLAIKTVVSFPDIIDTQPVRMTLRQPCVQTAYNIDYTDEINDTKSASIQRKSSEPTPTTAEVTTTLEPPVESSYEMRVKGDEATSIVGDAEIPSGAKIDRNLLVRGTLGIGENCQIHGKLQASKDITVGSNTVIDGNLVSGGKVTLGSCVLITGSLWAAGCIKIGERAVVEGGLRSSPVTEAGARSRIHLDVVEVEELG